MVICLERGANDLHITSHNIVARQSTRQFTQRDTHNQNVCIVTMRTGDG